MKNITLKKITVLTLLFALGCYQELKAQFTTDLPYVELTTEQEPGDNSFWYFWFEGNTEEDNNSIWVDWNFNGRYDEGEECPPTKSQMGNVVSQTIRVYGNITLFSCNEDYITKIDLSNNSLIEKLYFTNNKIESVDVSNLVNLREFCCNGNLLKTVDVSKNTNLELINCSNNLLTNVDVSKNVNLLDLECGINDIESIDISNNSKLQSLYCNETKLTGLDLSKVPNLLLLNIADNKIESVDLSGCKMLDGIDCRGTLIKNLDLSDNPNLTQLICDETDISSIDLSKNPELTLLSCAGCNISELDLSKHSKLEKVIVTDNRIEKLDFSSATEALYEVYCYNNNISEKNMEILVNSLPDMQNAEFEGWLFVIDTKNTKELNVCNRNHVDTAKGKRWFVYDFRNGENYGMNSYEGSEPSSLYSASGRRVAVWAYRGAVNISVPESMIGQEAVVYDITGKAVYSCRLNDANVRIDKLQSGVYMVAVGQKAWKIAL